MIVLFLFFSAILTAQVQEIFTEDFQTWDPETNNGWTISNGTAVNRWTRGTAVASTGTHSMYVSNDGGVTNNYTIAGAAGSVFFWRDVVIPAGAQNIKLTFDILVGGELPQWDFVRVFLAPQGTVYEYTSAAPPTVNDIGTFNHITPWQTRTIHIPASHAGQTRRLAFCWRNDNLAGNSTQPAGSIDNIRLTYQSASPQPFHAINPMPSDFANHVHGYHNLALQTIQPRL
jgi:hypothetical protein